MSWPPRFEVPHLVVGPVGHQGLQFRRVEEVLADVGAVLGLEGLVLAVDSSIMRFFRMPFLSRANRASQWCPRSA